MRSYVLVSGDFRQTGGMDCVNFALADYLRRQGHEVHLVAHRVADELLRHPNITFHRVPKILHSYFLSSPLLDYKGRSVARAIAANGGHVLVNGGNCCWGDTNWVHYVNAAFEPEVKGGILRWWKGKWSRRVYIRQEKKAISMARVIIANSERTKEHLVQLLGIPEKKIHVIYLGIETEKFTPPDDAERLALRQKLGWNLTDPYVVFIGALGDRRKGFDTLFAAWQQLCKDIRWDATLIVVGAGVELPTWQARANKVGMNRRISFLGYRKDVPDILRASDAVVAPTRYEPYGLGTHEAISCGLPAIVSATAGVAERYPPELAPLLVQDPNDVEDLTRKILHWRENREHFQRTTAEFSAFLRSYSREDMAIRIAALMDANEQMLEIPAGDPSR